MVIFSVSCNGIDYRTCHISYMVKLVHIIVPGTLFLRLPSKKLKGKKSKYLAIKYVLTLSNSIGTILRQMMG